MAKKKRKSSTRGFKLPTIPQVRKILNKVSRKTLTECIISLWRVAPKRAKITIAMKLEKAPKKAVKRATKVKAKRKIKKRPRKMTTRKRRTTRKGMLTLARRRAY